MKARTRFAVLMLVVTLVLGGVVYGQLELAKDRSVERMQENVDQTAARTAEQIDAQIGHEKNYVGFYASRPDASNFSRSDEFLRRFLSNPHVHAGKVIASNGTVVAFRGNVTKEARRDTIGEDFGDRSYVRRTTRTGEISVTDPERVSGTDRYAVIISAPIFEDGEIVGVLVADLPVNEFTFLPMAQSLETERRTVSVTADGRVLHDPARAFTDAVASTATVESTGWTVRVSRDRSALDARLREMAVVQIASLALVLSLIVAMAVWEYNANIRQAEKLLDGFRALRNGDYDYTPNLSSGEEWHQIREGFEELATALSDREAELEESQQRLQVFNRVLRHNLRNDLTVVVNYAEFVAEQSDDPAICDAAEKIASHGWDLVHTSEKASRIENSMRDEEPGPTPVDVSAVATEAAAEVRSSFPDADVSTDCPDGLYGRAIPAFPAAVENLCENGVEHNDNAEPTVSVSVDTVVEDGEEWIRIAVADDGPGIPAHERTVLTEGEETDLEHGSGLGLWLVHWVVERSGGRLSFTENEPRGSIVRIDLRPVEHGDYGRA
ncbi:sensor histidine kinase [Halorussus litoreus]|uniref:sensor histidine kinase n=1 Tax=Halorussus litoreus TaxID=1710536 RepID=UPI000E24E1E9|nr:sensor histidine kinase [Halorussus litoreus]